MTVLIEVIDLQWFTYYPKKYLTTISLESIHITIKKSIVLQAPNSSIYSQLFSWESQHLFLPVETAPSHEKASATKTTPTLAWESLGFFFWGVAEKMGGETKPKTLTQWHSRNCTQSFSNDGRCNNLRVYFVSSFHWTCWNSCCFQLFEGDPLGSQQIKLWAALRCFRNALETHTGGPKNDPFNLNMWMKASFPWDNMWSFHSWM